MKFSASATKNKQQRNIEKTFKKAGITGDNRKVCINESDGSLNEDITEEFHEIMAKVEYLAIPPTFKGCPVVDYMEMFKAKSKDIYRSPWPNKKGKYGPFIEGPFSKENLTPLQISYLHFAVSKWPNEFTLSIWDKKNIQLADDIKNGNDVWPEIIVKFNKLDAVAKAKIEAGIYWEKPTAPKLEGIVDMGLDSSNGLHTRYSPLSQNEIKAVGEYAVIIQGLMDGKAAILREMGTETDGERRMLLAKKAEAREEEIVKWMRKQDKRETRNVSTGKQGNENWKNIRDLLVFGFSSLEMHSISYHNTDFAEFKNEVNLSWANGAMADALIGYIDRNVLVDELLNWANQNNPSRYDNHKPYFVTNAPPITPELRRIHKRRLQGLRLQKAKHGLNCPVGIEIEIEEIEAILA